MAPKHHPTPLSGSARKALGKELSKARAMTAILKSQAAEARAKGETLIRQADKLLCEAPWDEAKALQRPLPDGALRIIASGEMNDPATTT